jgi:hypothetical protein
MNDLLVVWDIDDTLLKAYNKQDLRALLVEMRAW